MPEKRGHTGNLPVFRKKVGCFSTFFVFLEEKQKRYVRVLMQSTIIDEILKIEDEASQIVSDAEKKARDMIFDAQTKAKDLVASAVDEVKAESDALIRSEEELLEADLKAYEARKAELENSEIKVDEDSLERAVKRIMDVLLTAGV